MIIRLLPPLALILIMITVCHASGQTTRPEPQAKKGHARRGDGGGSLVGALGTAPSSPVDLTAEGSLDWVQWGPSDTTVVCNRKAGVARQISDYKAFGPGIVAGYDNNSKLYKWSDGTPLEKSNGSANAVWADGVGAGAGTGFAFTVKADRQVKTLKIYVGNYSSIGRLEASLTDGSAPDYVEDSRKGGTVFTIKFRAASDNQQLKLKWTQIDEDNFGNISLHAATLAGGKLIKHNPPEITIISPLPGTVLSGNSIQTDLKVNARDKKAGLAKVEFFARGSLGRGLTKIGETGAPPYTFRWTNVLPDDYEIFAAATDNLGATTHSAPVRFSINPVSTEPYSKQGSLAGSFSADVGNIVDLSDEGALDWAHWGHVGTGEAFNYKEGVPRLISNYAKIGSDYPKLHGTSLTFYRWSDGYPLREVNRSASGVWTTESDNGFQFTALADNTQTRTLKVYVSTWGGAIGKMTASLSDASAPDYVDISQKAKDQKNGVYTITYRAATGGQSLIVRWTIYDKHEFGNATLYAATLTGEAPKQTQAQNK